MTSLSGLNNLVDGGFLPVLFGWEITAAAAEPLMKKTHCLAGSMVLPDVEFLYISPPLRIGGRKGMGKKLNNYFKASARSAGRRRLMCVRIARIKMRLKMKCRYATLRKTVPVFHRMCIAHMNFSDKYIIIKSCLFLFFMPSMQHYC